MNEKEIKSKNKLLSVILKIDAMGMFKDGCKFYESENGVWLTDFVNTKYIIF